MTLCFCSVTDLDKRRYSILFEIQKKKNKVEIHLRTLFPNLDTIRDGDRNTGIKKL